MGWRETLVLSGVLFVLAFSGALGAMIYVAPNMTRETLAPLPRVSALDSAASNLDPHTQSVVIAIMPDFPLKTVCMKAVPDGRAPRGFPTRFINGQLVEAEQWTQWGCQAAIRDRGETVSVDEGMAQLVEARTPADPPAPPHRRRRPTSPR
jgi:hypothetical protein